MKKQSIINASAILTLSSAMVFSFLTSCEGPQGIAGVDANESCKECHNPTWVDQKVTEFDLSKHKYGEAAFEEAGNAGCAPCHESEAFKFVCKNNTPSTFTLDPLTNKYVNGYMATVGVAYGELSCFTCHSSLHSKYDSTDIYPLTSVAPVAMSMWGGAKTIDLTQGDGESNLCVKCHQPRPLTASLKDGNVIDYAAIANNPTGMFFEFGATATNKLNPSYRTHVHYGAVGALYAGMGGVEFLGGTYSSSAHTTLASCQDCHMAAITGRAGGHTFVAKGNFNGCNTADCHESAPLDAKSAKFVDTQAAVKALLVELGAKIVTADNIEILHKQKDAELNLWASLTPKGYDGYLDVFDPSTNPNGVLQNPAPAGSWSQANKDINAALPTFSLTNAQMGAIINFQFCLREYSLGIHNTAYSKALLNNSIAALN